MLDVRVSDILGAIVDGGYDIDSLDFIDSLDDDDFGGDVL